MLYDHKIQKIRHYKKINECKIIKKDVKVCLDCDSILERSTPS